MCDKPDPPVNSETTRSGEGRESPPAPVNQTITLGKDAGGGKPAPTAPPNQGTTKGEGKE